MKSSSVVVGILIIGGLAVGAAGLAWFKYGQIKAAAAQAEQAAQFIPPESAEALVVAAAPWQPTAELVGTALAVQSITLSNEVAGTVTKVLFESGALVEAGEVLVTLDDTTEQADLRAAEANIRMADAAQRAARTRWELAETNLQRMNAVSERAMAATDVDQAKAAVDSARAELDRAAAEIDQMTARVAQIKTLINKKVLRAPFRARAGLRNIHPGQYLAEGTSVVGLQGVSDTIYVDFAVPQEHAGRVRIGDSVHADSPLFGPGGTDVKVVAMDAVADRTTRNIRVRAEVPNPEERIRPGMFVDVRVPVGPQTQPVMIPATAVRRASFGDHVFVLDPADAPGMFKARQKPVVLGPSVGTQVIVVEGLKPGDRIAAVGSFKLRDGALVAPPPPPGAAPGSPAGAPPAQAGGPAADQPATAASPAQPSDPAKPADPAPQAAQR